jgi:DNA-binding transcriptional LysR family regulator
VGKQIGLCGEHGRKRCRPFELWLGSRVSAIPTQIVALPGSRPEEQAMNLNRVDLNLLVALDALLAERNVTRAGKRLSLSQPAMSAALARLRKMFDDPLLVRNGRQLRPTPLAESLVQPIHEILTLIEDTLSDRPAFDPATDARTFSVAAGEHSTIVLLRRLYEVLAKEAPQVRLAVRPLDSRYAEQLARGEVDLVVLTRELAPPPADCPMQVLYTDRIVGAACRHHPDVRGDLTASQFAELPYIRQPHGTLSAYTEAQLDEAGLRRCTTMTTESATAAAHLLRGTRLVTVLPERFGEQVADVAEIRLFRLPAELRPLSEAMYWHPRRHRDVAHQWLRDKIAAIADGTGR